MVSMIWPHSLTKNSVDGVSLQEYTMLQPKRAVCEHLLFRMAENLWLLSALLLRMEVWMSCMAVA
jgi:hypothetical protein